MTEVDWNSDSDSGKDIVVVLLWDIRHRRYHHHRHHHRHRVHRVEDDTPRATNSRNSAVLWKASYGGALAPEKQHATVQKI